MLECLKVLVLNKIFYAEKINFTITVKTRKGIIPQLTKNFISIHPSLTFLGDKPF